ncbi:MAG: hypothetical protein ACYC0N_02255 [Carboxydocellales bacterium]
MPPTFRRYQEQKQTLGVLAYQTNPNTGEPYNVITWVRTETRKQRTTASKKYVPQRLSPYWRKEIYKMFGKWRNEEV